MDNENGDRGCRFLFYIMDLQRPTYILDPDKVRENIRMMAAKATRSGVIFRPHFKTHQSRLIGNWFREQGVSRITVSSLSMARYFCDAGWADITVAFPVNVPEISLINDLASRIRLGLLVEDSCTVEKLAGLLISPVDLYIKVDCGYHRTGLDPSDIEEIVKIIRFAKGSPLTRFRGLLTHAGNTYSASGPDEVRMIATDALQTMIDLRLAIGNPAGCLISVGDTPSCSILETVPGADEIRPGNFVFYDLMQMELGSCSFNQVAGIVVCPVVAVHPGRGQAVVYGGAVHFSKDRIVKNGKPVFGQLVEWGGSSWGEPVKESFLISLSQEHGILEAPDSVIRNLSPGMFIGIIPVHSCLTANLLRGYTLVTRQTVDHMQGI